jgi:hypothetical protein
MSNPFEELHNLSDAEAAPSLEGAAEAISEGLSGFTNAKGKLRPRPMSWAKKVARDHFGWTRIGSKKFEQILEIGFSKHWFEKTEQGRLVGSSVPDRVAEQTKLTEMGSEMGSKRTTKHTTKDMTSFYRSGGVVGGKVLTEDDWDGQTYTIIDKNDCRWLTKPIQVPTWSRGQVLYELYDEKVRQDKAEGAEHTHCTCCKSWLLAEDVYEDSHGRYACGACNDLLPPSLRRGPNWKPPKYKPTGIKSSKKETDPSPKENSNSNTNSPNSNMNSLGQSIRDDKVADLMDAEDAIKQSGV